MFNGGFYLLFYLIRYVSLSIIEDFIWQKFKNLDIVNKNLYKR